MYEIYAKTFFQRTFMCAPSFLVCDRLTAESEHLLPPKHSLCLLWGLTLSASVQHCHFCGCRVLPVGCSALIAIGESCAQSGTDNAWRSTREERAEQFTARMLC